MRSIRNNAFLVLLVSVIAAPILLNSCSSQKETDEFAWSFAGKSEIAYDYTMDYHSMDDMNGDTVEQEVDQSASLTVTPKNDSLADITMVNKKLTVQLKAPGIEPETRSGNPPALDIPNMKKDGSFADENTNVLYRLLFPLPHAKMPRGETHVIKLELPVRIGPSNFQCKGYIQLTRKQREDYKGIACEVFYAEFKMDDLQVPEGTVDQYVHDFYGSATYYFDPKVGQFVSADIVAFTYISYETDLEAEDYKNEIHKNEATYHYELRNLGEE